MGEFVYIKCAKREEKPNNDFRSGYSIWRGKCSNIIIRRNDSTTKQCNCNKKRGKKRLTFVQKKEIVEFYKLHPISLQEVCNEFDISEPTLIKILKFFKCKEWSKTMLFSPNLQENYFEDIDTNEKAYFLGLLITDGKVFIKNNTYKVSITLQEQDKYLIENFCREINLNKKVTSDGRGCYGVQVCSKKMCEDLKKYHIVPNKTFTIKLPKLDDKYMPHFLRGCIDGNGSISFYEQKSKRLHRKMIILCSASKMFLEDVKDFLAQKLGICGFIREEKQDKLFQIYYNKNSDIYKLINYLYNYHSIYMKRKYDKVLLIKKELENTEITKESKESLAS